MLQPVTCQHHLLYMYDRALSVGGHPSSIQKGRENRKESGSPRGGGWMRQDLTTVSSSQERLSLWNRRWLGPWVLCWVYKRIEHTRERKFIKMCIPSRTFDINQVIVNQIEFWVIIHKSKVAFLSPFYFLDLQPCTTPYLHTFKAF